MPGSPKAGQPTGFRWRLSDIAIAEHALRDAALVQTGAMMLTSGWPFHAPAIAGPPPIADAIDKEAALSAIAAVSHGPRRHCQVEAF